MHTEFYLPGYPYHPDVLHEWMEIPNIYDSSHGVIKVYNGASLTGDSVCQDLRNSLRNNRHEFYYHATSWMSATAIYEKGVDLKRGRKSQDFSNSDGYYLHKMLKPAVTWAQTKGDRRPAILVYAYTISIRFGFRVLNLCGLRNEQLWKDVVKACRSGNVRLAPTTNPPLRNADCIIGPICANGSQCPKGRVDSLREIDFEGETLHNYTQICVKRRMARWIDSKLVGIVFLSPTEI